jgi:hypothetical protein
MERIGERQEVAEAYLHLLKTVLLETPSVTTADVNALLKFHDENHIDFEVRRRCARAGGGGGCMVARQLTLHVCCSALADPRQNPARAADHERRVRPVHRGA